jgi:hypothetical protein
LGAAYTLDGRSAYAVSLLTQAIEQTTAAFYRQALALAEELGMRPLVAHCHLGLGKLYVTIGRRAKARAELSAAVALYRTMDMTFWLPEAEAALAQTEGAPGPGGTAEPADPAAETG